MAAIIEVDGETATLQTSDERGWFWASTSAFLEFYLNSQLPEDGPSGADPDPLGNEAERMAEVLNGIVVHRDPVEYVPGRVY